MFGSSNGFDAQQGDYLLIVSHFGPRFAEGDEQLEGKEASVTFQVNTAGHLSHRLTNLHTNSPSAFAALS